MPLPDGLSRVPVSDANHIPRPACDLKIVQFTQPRINILQQEIDLEATLTMLKDVIIKGWRWPERRQDLPKAPI